MNSQRFRSLVFFAMGPVLLGAFSDAFARGHVLPIAQTQGNGSRTRLVTCWTDPSSDSTEQYGFIFSLEPENNAEIAVDTYALTNQLKKVKQISHAETTLSGNFSSGFSFSTANDSPTDFTLTLSQVQQGSGDPYESQIQSEWEGALTTDALFSMNTLSCLTLKCNVTDPRILDHLASSGSASPSPAPSATVTPTPTASVSPTPSPSASLLD